MNRLAPAILALLVFGCATQPATVSAPSKSSPTAEIDQLFETYFEELLTLEPTTATSIGDNRYNDRLEITISNEWRAQRRAFDEKYLAALAKIDPATLPADRRLSYEMLQRNLEEELRGFAFPSNLQPINQFYSMANSFAQLGSGTSDHPFRTAKDYDDFLSRIRHFETWVDTAIANMREGVRQGVVQPRVLMEKALPQIEAHVVATPEESVFWMPVKEMPESVSAADRARLQAAYRESITNRVIPAYRRLAEYIRNDYMPHTRASSGMNALPNGAAWYAYRVGVTTTTSKTPEEIHQIGLSEVARIRGEMDVLRRRVGFGGDLDAFFVFLKTDERFFFKSREELLESYNQLKKTIDASTPRLFDMMPKSDYQIRLVEPFLEKSASSGSYASGSPDGTRPGIFYVNAYDLKARPRHAMEALLLHEGSPGHHFQISIQQELTTLPKFRRFDGYTAYTEGWGLYSESIGRELGMYTDPYQYYGKLEAELWRSIRLVLDTGIHAKGWTREQAIDYALKNSALGVTRATSEVERFMAIPSQALAYKMGQLQITALRRRAEEALGTKFDVKAFHRQVLEDGAMPLDLLERKIDAWIASQRGA